MYSLNMCQARASKSIATKFCCGNNVKPYRYKLKQGISCSAHMDAPVSLQNYYEAFAKRMHMAGIKPHYKIAIGVSGGADSMALCILASRWKCTELGENAQDWWLCEWT